ncbi:2-hydroxyacid dehydrogenase [Chitinasiproducens palmae]|uniref:Lactate dehydrogenase n=1 Tax=Chitinasiproducens palmae TaxID=1770053 RepID=A0A1H2PUP8_9BURK|nr:D-glycerate dehydrogenase [Chitinasiproducens palmae]SDV50960.1 Lactate dehydrogenase [Chitinasiproducens palmae]
MTDKVLVTRRVAPEALAKLRRFVEQVDVHEGNTALSEAELIERVGDATGLLVPGDVISAAVVAAAPRLRAVAAVSVGYNNLDIGAMNARGILATNTPDVLTDTTADLGWALMMATARRVTEAEHYLRAGRWREWQADLLLGQDVHHSTLGIIGMGRIGQAIARRARGFDMNVLYHNRSRLDEAVERSLAAEWVAKDELFRRADHVVVVVPYSPATRHLIGTAELALMKPTATLTNIARGGVVDEEALLAVLRDRRIAGAGLDVFEGEPDFRKGFLDLDNVVLLPHIGSASAATRFKMADLAVDNLIAALNLGPHAGRPAHVVNPEARRG